jgi:hypothetical protein
VGEAKSKKDDPRTKQLKGEKPKIRRRNPKKIKDTHYLFGFKKLVPPAKDS